MKRWMNFFGEREEKSKLTYHWDGISMGRYSLRLSNISKNISFLSHCLLTLAKQPFSNPFYGLAFLSVKAKANCQLEDVPFSNVYLNNSLENSYLWVHYDSSYPLGAINNTCNFTLANKQSGNYKQITCLCPTYYEGGVVMAGYRLALYGQNVSTNLVDCMTQFLEENCNKVADGYTNWAIAGPIFGGIAGCCVISAGLFALKSFCKKQRETQLVLNEENVRQPLAPHGKRTETIEENKSLSK